uniref:Uncharacterized protein n=1 Tax=Arundo donax TaxID=35708 RepID=A0A0A9AZ03_ARUDO
MAHAHIILLCGDDLLPKSRGERDVGQNPIRLDSDTWFLFRTGGILQGSSGEVVAMNLTTQCIRHNVRLPRMIMHFQLVILG